jgi:hypothetical protein
VRERQREKEVQKVLESIVVVFNFLVYKLGGLQVVSERKV